MRTLIVFRHGKSDWDADFSDDHERPLAKRGRKAAERMGRYLVDSGIDPEHIISSTAVRAARTAEIAATKGRWSGTLEQKKDLYHAGPDALLGIVRGESDENSTLVLVGHEPTMSESIALFTGGTRVQFPTAAMARIDFEIDSWTEAGWHNGTLAWLVVPRSLEN